MNNADLLARKRKLTARQAEVLAYVTQTDAPTREQIRVRFGFSQGSAVTRYVQVLIRKGALPEGWTPGAKADHQETPQKTRTAYAVGFAKTGGGFDLEDCEILPSIAAGITELIEATRILHGEARPLWPVQLLRLQVEGGDVIEAEPISAGELVGQLLALGRLK